MTDATAQATVTATTTATLIDEHVDVVTRLCQQGHVNAARGYAAGLVVDEPLVGHVASAAVAAATGDLPALRSAVAAASALAPNHAAVLGAAAVMHALAGDAELAYETARAAFGAGATARGRNALARLMLGIGKRNDGLAMLEALVADGDDAEAHMQLGAQKRMYGPEVALEHYVAAFLRAPTEPTPMQAILHEVRESSWPVGVAVLARHMRATAETSSLRFVADLLGLAARLYLKNTPLASLVETPPTLFTGALEAAREVPVGAQLVLAGLLVDLGRVDEAQLGLSRAAPALSTPHERAHHAFLEGRLAQAAGRVQEAAVRYEAALVHEPGYTDAACNLIDVLVGIKTPAANERIASVVAEIPESKRRLNPMLTYNEAGLLEMRGDRKGALELVAFLQEGPLGVLEPAVRAMHARLSRVTRVWCRDRVAKVFANDQFFH